MKIIFQILYFIQQNPAAVTTGAVALFELIARRKATEKDYSIINKIKLVIDFIIANKRKKGGTF
jgi:hypothetical protein